MALHRQTTAKAVKGIEMTIKIDLGSSALNDAGWKMLDEMEKYQTIEPYLFNHVKVCLLAAIEEFLNHPEVKEAKLK